MAEIAISQEWLNSLTSYLNQLQTEATRRSDQALNYLQNQVRDEARNTPGWEAMADDLTVWSADGVLYIGLSTEDYITQAWVLEYESPAALFNEFAQTATSARYGGMP